MCAPCECRKYEHEYLHVHGRPFGSPYFEVFKRTINRHQVDYFWINVHEDGEWYGFEHGPYYFPKDAYVNGLCEGD